MRPTHRYGVVGFSIFSPMRISELYKVFQASSGVSTDSRRPMDNQIFFCLKGPNFDANTFAKTALEKGALHVIADDPSLQNEASMTVVDDALQTLQDLAKHHRSQFAFPVIGLTGSNGKTTNKELIHAVLSRKYRTYSTTGNLNNHIGVPLSLLAIPLDAEMAVIEMGANHQGEIRELCTICTPDIGMITNIGKAHLEGFGGIEGVKKGKKELYDFLKTHKRKVFVNGDDPVLMELSVGLERIYFGVNDRYFAFGDVVDSQPFLSFQFNCKEKNARGRIQTQLVGNYNFYNAMAAVAIGCYFDVPQTAIMAGIEHYAPENNRSQLKITHHNKVILDAYNANPSSMILAIDNLADGHDEPKIAILGHMMELGSESQEEHQALVNRVAEKDLDAIFVGQHYADCQLYGCAYFANVAELNEYLANHPLKGYTILLKGSRATTMERVLEKL